jgi:hypothetical protein
VRKRRFSALAGALVRFVKPHRVTMRTNVAPRPVALDLTLAAIVTALAGSSGCRAIEGIFKAGVWTGIVGFIVLLAIVLGVMKLFTGSRA